MAIPMSFSRKGPWKCARTLAVQTGMTIKWLKDQGLLSVKELWVKIHFEQCSWDNTYRQAPRKERRE